MTHNVIDKKPDPFFMVGFARSGTTWMNSVLRDYLDIGLVNEGQFIVEFGKKYGKSEKISRLDKFAHRLSHDEFFSILEKVYGISIDWTTVLGYATDQTYSCLIKSILTDIATQQGKTAIGSKSPGFGWNMDLLLGHFPNCKVIHIIRDGRDCALSHYEMSWGRRNAYVAASKWQEHIQLIRKSVLAHDAAYLEVRYEDILYNPALEFKRLADFVFKEGGRDYDNYNTDELANRFAETVGKHDYDKRTHKWQMKMSASDKAIFESVAGELLAGLGYETEAQTIPIPLWRRGGYIVHDRLAREFNNIKTKLTKAKPKKTKLNR